MDRDFFISLCLATHRVGNLFNAELKNPLKRSANVILARLVLLSEGALNLAQKKAFAQDVLQELQSLEKHFELAKAQESINPENFSILEGEYAKVKLFSQGFLNEREQEPVSLRNIPRSGTKAETVSARETGAGKSLRGQRILTLISSKEKAQVWELQKVFPQVTKRTLRRDLDALVKEGALERKGEWNTVYYQVKTAD